MVKRLSVEGSTKHELQTAFSRVGERRFSGYAVDPASLDQRFTVEISVDGYIVRVIRADTYVRELAQQSLGDGFYGFSVSLDARAVNGGAVAAARLANLGTAVGDVIALARPSPSGDPTDGPGSVRWLGGLRFSGWVSEDQNPAAMNVLVDGVLIDRIRISRWSHVGTGDAARAVRSFDVFLPPRFGDGGVHQFAIVTANGENLNGCPHTFLAFADGLRDFVATHDGPGEEIRRAELFDQLVPGALPFAQYRGWQQRFPIVGGQSTIPDLRRRYGRARQNGRHVDQPGTTIRCGLGCGRAAGRSDADGLSTPSVA